MGREVIITLRLYGGLDRDLRIQNYDSSKGLEITIRAGTRLRRVLKDLGLTKFTYYSFFSGGEEVSLRKKLTHGEEISCFKPAGGG